MRIFFPIDSHSLTLSVPIVMPPFLLPLLFLALGIFIGDFFRFPFWCSAAAGLTSLTGWLVMKLLTRSPRRAVTLNNFHSFWVAILFFSVGLLAEILKRPAEVDFSAFPESARGVARVEALSRRASGDRLTVRFQESGARGILFTGATPLRPGDLVSVPLGFTPVGNSRLHPDYIRHLSRCGINYSQYLKPEEIMFIGHREDLFTLASGWRDNLEVRIEKSGLSRQSVSFLVAVLLGDSEFISPEQRSLFSGVGLAHLLALSGMHVGIILMVVMTLLFPLGIMAGWKTKYLISIVLLWAFVLLSGCSPSTVRASLMASFCFMAIMLERRHSALNALFFALFVILLFNPYALFMPSLQLSATCVFALICFGSRFNTVDHRLHPLTYRISSSLWPPLIATGGTWALAAYYFGGLPLAFFPANLIVLPLLPAFIGVAFLFFLIPSSWPVSGWLGYIIDAAAGALNSLCVFFSRGGDTFLRFEPDIMVVFLWTGGLALLAAGLAMRRKLKVPGNVGVALSTLAMAVAIILPFVKSGSEGGGPRLWLAGDSASIAFELREGSRSGGESKVKRGSVASFVTPAAQSRGGSAILVVDRKLDRKIPPPEGFGKWTYILLASGCRLSVGELREFVDADTLLLHQSLWPRHEISLSRDASTLGLPVLSLRNLPSGFSFPYK